MISVHCIFRIFFVCNRHWSHCIIWKTVLPSQSVTVIMNIIVAQSGITQIELCSSEIWVSVSFTSLFWFHPWGSVSLVWPQLSLWCISTLFPLAGLLRKTTLHCFDSHRDCGVHRFLHAKQ